MPSAGAIPVYLALRYDPACTWLSEHPAAAARVQRWPSVAAGELAHGTALARLAAVLGAELDHRHAKAAGILLGRMEAHLERRDLLAGLRSTVADLACHGYAAHAPEGGVPLGPYPAARAWTERVTALPGFVAM